MSSKPAVTRPRTLKVEDAARASSNLGFRWGRINSALLAVGRGWSSRPATSSLSKGSITLAPVLLVTGYCVLIPASLLVRGSGPEAGE